MTMATTDTKLSPAVLEAIAIGSLPDVQWKHDDDLCDCTFQRIGMWKNPYLATTHEIRLCCVWEELAKSFPDFVRTIPGYFNENTQQWETEVREWDGEDQMPASLWHRQLARLRDITVSEARSLNLEPPKGRQRIPFYLVINGSEYEVDMGSFRLG